MSSPGLKAQKFKTRWYAGRAYNASQHINGTCLWLSPGSQSAFKFPSYPAAIIFHNFHVPLTHFRPDSARHSKRLRWAFDIHNANTWKKTNTSLLPASLYCHWQRQSILLQPRNSTHPENVVLDIFFWVSCSSLAQMTSWSLYTNCFHLNAAAILRACSEPFRHSQCECATKGKHVFAPSLSILSLIPLSDATLAIKAYTPRICCLRNLSLCTLSSSTPQMTSLHQFCLDAAATTPIPSATPYVIDSASTLFLTEPVAPTNPICAALSPNQATAQVRS